MTAIFERDYWGPKWIGGTDIQWCRHVELNLRGGQDIVQVGAGVADIERGVIATNAVVERGESVLHSPAA